LVRRAFTLVELLVVIGIVALLMALLLTTLRSMRERAQRATCLSNLRQLHLSFHLYALDHRQRVPLGYRKACQFNSMLFSATADRFVLFGHLYQRNLLTQPGAYFCPTEGNPRFQFDTSDNPWPMLNVVPTRNVQLGYSMRPEVEIPDVFDADTRLPRLTDFRSRAILADLTAARVRVDTRHRTGINALFGDGSASWAPRQQLEPWLSMLPEPLGAPNPAFDVPMRQMWQGLDRR
jgi:prepilin-type N-terminal cleavage/methylation domain-containing protein/prepilin-type processing-associated H-X9-DG protein